MYACEKRCTIPRNRGRIVFSSLVFLAGILSLCYDAICHTGDFQGRRPDSFRASRYRTTTPTFNARNRTLGFGSIQVINLPHRFDRYDSIVMQAEITDLDITFSDGVRSSDIQKSILPPTSDLNENEIACIRAHALTWRKMLQQNLATSLIMESDADWEVTIKASMSLIMENMPRLLRAGHTTASKRSSVHSQHVDNWDVLQLGVCQELPNDRESDRISFADPYVPKFDQLDGGQQHLLTQYYGGQSNQAQSSGQLDSMHFPRIIQRSNGSICTTAYAVSRTGAMKLLHQTSRFLDDAVDVIMNRMASRGLLSMFTVVPPIVGQWKYIGDDRPNSDIGRHSWQDRQNVVTDGIIDTGSKNQNVKKAQLRSVDYLVFNGTWQSPPNVAHSAIQAVAASLWPDKV